jgi:hypothetical protein
LRELARTILAGVRDADLVSSFNSNTIVVLPGETAAHGLGEFVGRLRSHLREAWGAQREVADAGEPKVGATWLDPKDARPISSVLAEAFGPKQP